MLNEDFRELIELLNSNKVKYLLVGDYAIAFHGHPRYTKDLDIWLEASEENATSVLKALNDFGFGDLDVLKVIFCKKEWSFNSVIRRIELIKSIRFGGVDFAECYETKIEIDDLKISVIDLENLKKNKKASGRLQDLADVEKLSQ